MLRQGDEDYGSEVSEEEGQELQARAGKGKRRAYACGSCGQTGHNSRRCPTSTTQGAAAKKPKRPRPTLDILARGTAALDSGDVAAMNAVYSELDESSTAPKILTLRTKLFKAIEELAAL